MDAELDFNLWLKCVEIDAGSDLNLHIQAAIEGFIARIATTERGPSGLVFKNYLSTTLSFSLFERQFGGHFQTYLDLPDIVRKRKAIDQIESNDDNCFEAAIDYFFQKQNLDSSQLERRAVTPLMSLKNIFLFEKDNPHLRIHVLVCEMSEKDHSKLDHFVVAYKSKNPFSESSIEIPLLLHRRHYYLISDVGKLLGKSTKKGRTQRNYFCFSCLSCFNRRERFEKHDAICGDKHLMVPSFPKKHLQFSEWWALLSPPYCIYYDMETYYSEIPEDQSQKGRSTRLKAEVKPIKIGYKILFSDPVVLDINPPLRKYERVKIFSGEDCIEQFFIDLKDVTYRIHDKIRHIVPMHLTKEEQRRFDSANCCGICHNFYSRDYNKRGILKDENLRACRHHDHLTG